MEQPNYRGFEYLVRELAARGYVALSININAENTFGFGEPVAGERLQQIVDQHLQALAAAAAGGPNEFGVELTGRADVNRLALFGHSRGGEAALVSANSPEMLTASRGYGPVAGVLLIAAATVTADPWSGSAVPLATILAACDGDVTTQDGQFFYEGARLAPQQSHGRPPSGWNAPTTTISTKSWGVTRLGLRVGPTAIRSWRETHSVAG